MSHNWFKLFVGCYFTNIDLGFVRNIDNKNWYGFCVLNICDSIYLR